MNKLELYIYNLVKNNPRLKQKIVDVYQRLLGFIPQKRISCDYPFTERIGFFYGFHDKSPFSSNGEFLLAHKVLIEPRELNSNDEIELGFFKGKNWEEFVSIDKTKGWNWQMGSMLQWRGASNNEVAYNIVSDGMHISRIKNIGTNNVVRDLPWPIVHISQDGLYGCSYNFHRAEKAMPGYGLISEIPKYNDIRSDYFRIFNLETSEVLFQISLEEIIRIKPHPSMDNAFHFFHHSLFNPSGTRLFFLHRWLDKNGRRWTRMFSVGVNGDCLYLFPMDEMVSHITWASDTEIFSYLRYPGEGDGYYFVEDQTGKYKRFFKDILNSDGHPTFSKNDNFVITDSYPDRYRNQFLILIDTQANSRQNLLRTNLPKKYSRFLQVDLHPRLHPFRKIACVDSAHNGVHSLITLDFTRLNQSTHD